MAVTPSASLFGPGSGSASGRISAPHGLGAAGSTSAVPAYGPRPRLPLWLVMGLMMALTMLALFMALDTWQRPIPGVLTDPFGRITNYGWPSWSGYGADLSFPDVILSVDGIDLPPPTWDQPYPARVLTTRAELDDRGHSPANLVVEHGGQRVSATVPIEHLSPLPWLVLFGGYAFLAWVLLVAAGLSYVLSPASPGVGAFIRWAVLNAVLLLTLFDWHTTRVLVPLYVLSCSYLPAAIIELGLRFPDDIPLLKWQPRLIWLVRAPGILLCLVVAAAWAAGDDPMLWPAAGMGLSVVMLGGFLLGRYLLATGRRQTQLLVGLIVWMPVYLCLGVVLAATPARVGGYALPPLIALEAVGILFALVRYDLWDTKKLLPRQVLRPLISAVLGFLAALLSSIVLLMLMDRVQQRWVLVLVVFVLVTLALPLHRAIEARVEGLLFPADAFYRPTVEQLSLRFTDLASRAAVVDVVETMVRQVLPCDRVRFLPLPPPTERSDRGDDGEESRSMPPGVLAMALYGSSPGRPGGIYNSGLTNSASMISSAPGSIDPPEWRVLRRTARAAGIDGIGNEQAAELCKGQAVQPVLLGASSRQLWARLILPARYRDQVVGLLAVSSKRRSQLFTSEDEDLLRTIANQAALALACANAYEQVESLRRAQQVAFREEKGAALGTVAAEIAHEIRFPINFFRMLLESYAIWLREGRPPEGEDVEIGREEVDRLERMAGNLRRIATTRTLTRQSTALRTLVDHVRLLLRDRLVNRFLEIEIDPQLDIDCDRDAMTQIVVNLVANALDACEFPGRAGVSAEVHDDGRLRLTVWDTGLGLKADIGKLFQPWFTTKKTGSGLGLAITRRLVRAHGWEIGAERRGDRTCFDVQVPAEEWHLRPATEDEGQFESGPLK